MLIRPTPWQAFAAVVPVFLIAISAFGASERVGDPYPLSADPVTGEDLAAVEQPVVLVHDGRELHFATQANADTFAADPEQYLTEVDKLIVQQQTPGYPLETCVVSGDALGGPMGEPVDYVYGNRLVRFCCAGCVDTFNKDAAKYLDQLDAAVIEQQRDAYPLDTCVVSGQNLGAMGEPAEYVIANRLVKFCCPHCVAKFEQNPARYLSKLQQPE